jgi:acetylglutamate kinase
MRLQIFKIGGNVIDSPVVLNAFLDTFCSCRERKILVHGGGKLAGELAGELGVPVHMHQGRRITDAPTLRIAVMVYAGWINKSLVAALSARGCRAVGLSGADGYSVITRKRDPEPLDFGFVGDITQSSVDVLFTERLMEDGLVPVFSPITCDPSGQLLNTNADTIASALSMAFKTKYAVSLRYVFDKEGVCCPGSDEPLPLLSRAQYEKLCGEGVVTGGMIPKIENALKALSMGIEEVYIGKTCIQL